MGATKTFLSAALVTALLSGCTTYQIRHGAKQDLKKATADAEALLKQQRSSEKGRMVGPIITDLPYVDVRPVAAVPHYPAIFSRNITISRPAGTTLQQLADRVEAMTGVRMVYQPELIAGSPLSRASAKAAVSGGDSTGKPKEKEAKEAVKQSVLQGLDQMLAGLPNTASNSKTIGAINYSGSLVGLYRMIAESVGASWKYDEPTQTVRFYKYEQETFQIPVAEAVESSAKMKSGTTGSAKSDVGTLSRTDVDSAISRKDDPWTDIEDALNTLVSSEGQFAINKSAKMVVVRDIPSRMDSIRSYLSDYTQSLTRQVVLHVRMYRVMVKNTDQRSLDLSAAFSDLTSTLSLSTSNTELDENASSATFAVSNSDSKFAGSQATLNTLNQIGQTSVVQDTTLTTVNNAAALLKVVSNTTYLASMTQTSSSSTSYSTSSQLDPGSVESGLKCYLVPSVAKDGKRLLLTVMMSLSTLDELDTYGTDSASIQEPQTSARETQQVAWLKNGETLVMTGFQQNDTANTTSSPTDKVLWALGGSSSVDRNKELLVMTVTPVVTSVRASM